MSGDPHDGTGWDPIEVTIGRKGPAGGVGRNQFPLVDLSRHLNPALRFSNANMFPEGRDQLAYLLNGIVELLITDD